MNNLNFQLITEIEKLSTPNFININDYISNNRIDLGIISNPKPTTKYNALFGEYTSNAASGAYNTYNTYNTYNPSGTLGSYNTHNTNTTSGIYNTYNPSGTYIGYNPSGTHGGYNPSGTYGGYNSYVGSLLYYCIKTYKTPLCN